MPKATIISPELAQYVNIMTRQTALQKRLSEETHSLPQARMQTTPDQAAFLSMLVTLIGAQYAIEIGTFTGYSALAIASSLPKDGQLIACDISQEWTNIGKRYWKEAGLDTRIDLRLGKALDTLAALSSRKGTFDFVFIDADKGAYDSYYEASLPLLRSGGVIAFDNMLWSGRVADPNNQEKETKTLHMLNEKIRDDLRVDACLLTIGDGIMIARKR